MDVKDMITLARFAELAGVSYNTIVVYKAEGRLPDPDVTIGRSPLWKPSTVKAWLRDRPGQGWRKGRPGPHGSTTD